MRGTQSNMLFARKTDGIIPAHAGNTAPWFVAGCSAGDHPRTCGEHPTTSGALGGDSGSSPHMRGTLQRSTQRHQSAGIIPAHAGNTTHETRFVQRARDHPRTCGEHRINVNQLIKRKGSSPHMRGTRRVCLQKEVCLGIIPAHAGNTVYRGRARWCVRDHPRTCGEHRLSFSRNLRARGSSPHMRGTLSAFLNFNYSRRIIPAHAGNTDIWTNFIYSARDHPRTCGEHCGNVRGQY